ncbi:hypothetical protein TNCV_180191 [Trichonephila clavipes]|nr:hypothetical protein TNCV_180191 [Trichonephila clavipes]
MEILEMLKSIEYNERIGRPLTSRNAENAALVSEQFEKIVAKHLNKSLRLHPYRRRRLREYIRRKRPQFWQSDDWYLLHDNALAHRSQLGKEFLAKTRTNVLPDPPYSLDLVSCGICMFSSMKKHLHGRRFVPSDEVNVASQEVIREDFQKKMKEEK